jgi:MOSC domain-containing protein YiiM
MQQAKSRAFAAAPGLAGATGAGSVAAVCRQATHGLAKAACPAVRLLAGLGVEGDAHAGACVKHRYLAARDPSRPNLRQVHLIERELHVALAAAGFAVGPGDLGENITTSGIDLLALPPGARLRLGAAAEIEITGLRDPCRIINSHARGLMAAVSGKWADGTVFFRGALMAVVTVGGVVTAGDAIGVVLPRPPFKPLRIV